MWNQPSLFSDAETAYTVSEITARLRTLLERDPLCQNLWVTGEISNFSRAASGHVYFTLKDAGAQLACVIWKTQARALTFAPRDGDQVTAHGRIGLYEAGGRYQLYVDLLQPTGRGVLFQEFERLKSRLAAEGLFAEERKRSLPPYPRCIGIVTSPATAALRDVLNILRRRYPLAQVLLAPTLVQGTEAPPQIVAAIVALNARADVDVILVVRGGGSLEDLWAFNDERVVRAVAASRIPIISGVGHETDFTLTDFAADRRAPTPSAAAELATPDRAELQQRLWQVQGRLARGWTARLATFRRQVEQWQRTLRHLSPAARLAGSRQRVDDLTRRSEAALTHRLRLEHQRLTAATARLAALNPEAVLQRGYAIIAERESGRLITQAAQARPGQALTLRWHDGEVAARVESPPLTVARSLWPVARGLP